MTAPYDGDNPLRTVKIAISLLNPINWLWSWWCSRVCWCIDCWAKTRRTANYCHNCGSPVAWRRHDVTQN